MARYFPEIFDVRDRQRAKDVILTNEGIGADTETRWVVETPFVRDLVRAHLDLTKGSILLDYGCGIGRMAKALIEMTGCGVVGVDISPSMRALAMDYVGSADFMAVSPDQLALMVRGGFRASAAIVVWVLQHCLVPSDDIASIRRALAPGAHGVVLNMPSRAVPAVMDDAKPSTFRWATDDVDVAALLRIAFDVEAEGEAQTAQVPNMADAGAYWMRLRNRDA